jgi:hypothetical protein
MYSDTITLFNRYHSKLGNIWFPHVLRNVNLIVDKASIMAKYGAETTDKASLHIKYDGNINIQGLPYLPSKEWNKLTNDELSEYITFNSDSNYFDFFIIGEYEGTEPIVDDYIDGFFAHMEEQTECYAITSVSSAYKVIKHFEVMAR